MENVSNTVLDALYWGDERKVPKDPNNGKLGQEDFFRLLTQQMSMQDPTKPMDNDQMIAQMTNFTMAEGISDLSNDFKLFSDSMTSNQALQASSLVGQKVLIPSDVSYYNGSRPVDGIVSLPQTGENVQVRIKNEAGETVHTVDMGTLPQGQHNFSWDGTLADGSKAPTGDYVIESTGRMGGQMEALPALTYGFVESVSMGGKRGVILNLESIGRVDLKDVIQITSGGG